MLNQMCNGGMKGGVLFQSLLLQFLGGFLSFPATLSTLGETVPKMAEQSTWERPNDAAERKANGLSGMRMKVHAVWKMSS